MGIQRALAVALLCLCACGGGGGEDGPDAAIPDAAPPPDADFSCNVVFLNFEGQALTAGAADDASTNTSVIITGPQTAPAYLPADPDRDLKIQTITTQVTDTLAALGVTVVTERPATGDYTMVIIGGASTDIGFQAGVGGLSAFAGCNTPIPKRITFSFPVVGGVTQAPYVSANTAIGSYLVGFGTPTSSDPADCLCWDSPACNQPGECTLGGAATPRFDSSICGTGATFDEPAILATLLACD